MWEWIYRFFKINSEKETVLKQQIYDFKAKRAVKIIEKYYLNYKKIQKLKSIIENRLRLYRNKNINKNKNRNKNINLNKNKNKNTNLNKYIKKSTFN